MERDYRKHAVVGAKARHGNSTRTIRCPYCATDTVCYVRGLGGRGKRCHCGAIHYLDGYTYKEIK